MEIGVGIQLDKAHINIAAIKKVRNQYLLRYFSHYKISDKDDIRQSLELFFQQTKLNRHHVIMSLSSYHAIIRKFNVPFADPEKIDQIIHYESEPYIDSQAIENLTVDYHILEKENNKSRLFIVALPTEEIEEKLQVVESANVFPFRIDFEAIGLLHYALAAGLDSEERIILLEISQNKCNVLIKNKDELGDLRTIRLSVSSLAEGLASDFNETAEWRIDAEESEINQEQREKIFATLYRELKRMLWGSWEIHHIYICGDYEIAKDLSPFLQQKLEIPTSFIDICDHLEVDKIIDHKQLLWSPIAIGLAARSLGGTIGLNFRKGELEWQNSFDIIKAPLAIAITLVFVVSSLLCFFTYQSIQIQKQEYENLLKNTENIYKRTFPGRKLPQTSYWNQTYTLKQKLEFAANNQIPEVSDAAYRWIVLFDKVHQLRQKHYITVDEIIISPVEATLRGKVENISIFYTFRKMLENIDWVGKRYKDQELLNYQKIRNSGKKPLTRYAYLIRFKENKTTRTIYVSSR